MKIINNKSDNKYAIAMLIFKNPLYIVGACLSAWVHRKFIHKYNLNIKLIVLVDKFIYEYKKELEKYFDSVELIEIIEMKLNHEYKIINKYSDWMKFSISKWNIFKFDNYDKILFLDTDILPINDDFYNIFNFDTPSIMIKGNNNKENSIINTDIFLSNIKNISNEEYFNIASKLKYSLDAGIILIKPDKKIFTEYLDFIKICEGTNGYISKYDSGIDETTLLLFFVYYKKIPIHLIPYEYVPIPWEKNPYNIQNVRGINFLSMIKPWIKLPIIQWADENIWHIIAKKALDKHSKITKIYIKYLIDELYNFYYNWKKNISKPNSPYNMEIIKSKNIQNETFELFNYLGKYKKNNLDIKQIEYIINESTKIHKQMDKKLLINLDNLYKIIEYTDELKHKYKLARNINNINKLSCGITYSKNLTSQKDIFVDIFNLDGKKFVIKKEKYKNISDLPEFLFHKKFDSEINKTNFKNFILLPEKIIDCKNNMIYKYPKLNYDYNKTILEKISYHKLIDYTIELCLTLYYLNHKLKIFHNDLIFENNLRNIMIDYNEKKIDIEISLFKYSTNSNHIVIIDFGQSSYKPRLRTYKFYYNKYKKSDYKYISEVFIMYYYFYKFHNKIDDCWNEKYDELYNNFLSNTSNSSEFDRNIIKLLFELKYKLNIRIN
jgi:hypothetical protein